MKGRDQFRGLRVAVAGMGVSGQAVARAVRAMGGTPTVLDQKPADAPGVLALVDHLAAEGIEAITGWPGRLDPNDFDWLVVSPGVPPHHPMLEDMRGKVMGEVEFAWRVAEAPILAVTGTNGKSTTTVMTYLALTGAGLDARLCGNISGSGYPEVTLTQAAFECPADGVLVAEVSSAQLETTIDFCPHAASITNITPDHLDRYGSFEPYRAAKFRMFRNMTGEQIAFLNHDEPSVTEADIRAISREVTVRRFSPSGQGPAEGQTRRIGDSLWLSGQEVALADLPWYGDHNLSNAMLAWELAASVTRPDIGMFRGLMTFRNLGHRMELLGEKNGVRVVNNSMCTNPMAVVASSKSVPGRQHLLMGGKTKNLDFAPVEAYLKENAHKVYLFGPEPHVLNNMIGGSWPQYASLEAAFAAATDAATAGETILLAPGCASADPYVHFRERGEAFRAMAKEWLEQ